MRLETDSQQLREVQCTSMIASWSFVYSNSDILAAIRLVLTVIQRTGSQCVWACNQAVVVEQFLIFTMGTIEVRRHHLLSYDFGFTVIARVDIPS